MLLTPGGKIFPSQHYKSNANTNKNKDHINGKFGDEMHAEFIVHYWS